MKVFVAGSGHYGAGAVRAVAAMPDIEVIGTACDADDPMNDAVYDAGLPDTMTLGMLRCSKPTAALFAYLGVDLLLLANVPVLTPMEVLHAAAGGSLCYHPSLLPRWRGRDAVRATLAAGDKVTGVSIFRPVERADAGPIVWQRSCPVPEGVSAGRLYYGTLVPLGIDAMVHAVAALRDGMACEQEQDEAQATYDRDVLTLQLTATSR